MCIFGHVKLQFYLKEDNHHKAIENFEKELEVHKLMGETHESNPEFYWDAYDTLAQCYGSENLEAKCIEYYELAIKILTESINIAPEVRLSIFFTHCMHYIF